jgi:hypothetical protein
VFHVVHWRIGIGGLLNGTSDSSLSIRITASRMSAAGLQELAEALLQTLAIESHEKELQHLAHRARIWQDGRQFRSEREEGTAQKKLRQVAKLATDTR